MTYPEGLTYSNFRDVVEQKLQDASNVVFSTTELDYAIEEGFREASNYRPYIYKAEFNLESRMGTATADTANALVDTTLDQFVAGDVGKWVYNSQDRVWAQVTAYVSATQLTLNKDAFPDGNEPYQMFNKGCTDSKEFSIDAVQQPDGANGRRTFDWLRIDKIEYPILQDPPRFLKKGEWELQENNIIRLKVDEEPDNTKETTARDEVWVYFCLRHKLSQLTTLLGKINLAAGYAAGLTSVAMDDLQSSGTLYKGQEFTIDNCRGIYIVDYQRTISSNACDPVSFWPPLKDAINDNETVRFRLSTLAYADEGVFADLIAGKAAISKARTYVGTIGPGGNRYRNMLEWGKLHYNDAIAELKNIEDVAPSIALP